MDRPAPKSDGVSIRCPACEALLRPRLADTEWTAPCPKCGRVLWLLWLPDGVKCYRDDEVSARKREKIRALVGTLEAVPPDSLDVVELILEFEELFDFGIPDDVARRIRSPGDMIDFIVFDCPE